MGILLVVSSIQTTEPHSLSQRRLPDVVVVDQGHGVGLVGGVVVCEDEEMIDGNDEADPCLICLGPRPYSVTCHQDRTDPYLPSRSSSSRHRHAIIVPLVLITSSFFRHSLLVTIMLFLSLRHPEIGRAHV